MPVKVCLANPRHIDAYHRFLKRTDREQGHDGDIIFGPEENPTTLPLKEFRKDKTKKWKKSHKDIGWERVWLLMDGKEAHGKVRLYHQHGLKSTLHRAMLSIEIEKSHRSQGYGVQLMETALVWAHQRKTIDWIQLYVFEKNVPAQKLYKKFKFKKVATVPDMFRVHGTSVADTEMVLKLK